jgi:hypothetical protein
MLRNESNRSSRRGRFVAQEAIEKWWASCSQERARLLLGLEVVEEDGALLRLLTPVLDDNARAVDDLAGVAFTVNLAYSMH